MTTTTITAMNLRYCQKPPNPANTVSVVTAFVVVHLEGRIGTHMERNLCRQFMPIDATSRLRGPADTDKALGALDRVDIWITRWMGQPATGVTFYIQDNNIVYTRDRFLFAHALLAFRAGATRCAVIINSFTQDQTRIFRISRTYARALHNFARRRRAGTSKVNALENYFNANITPVINWESPSVIRDLTDGCAEWNDGPTRIIDNDPNTNPAIASDTESIPDIDANDADDDGVGKKTEEATTGSTTTTTTTSPDKKKTGHKRTGRPCRYIGRHSRNSNLIF